MSRIKRGTISRRRHKKLLNQARGYRGTKSKLVKMAHEATLHAGAYAYKGRKLRKRDFRRTWISRISEGSKKEGISYSMFMNKMKTQKVELDRKILAQLIVEDPQTFKHIVDTVKSA